VPLLQEEYSEGVRKSAGRPSVLRLRLPWSRAKIATCAVVAQLDVDPALLREHFPGWIVLRPGDPFVERQFDRIVVLLVGGGPVSEWNYEAEAAWLLKLRDMLPPGAAIEMMACSETDTR
jgi:hypothetical protein